MRPNNRKQTLIQTQQMGSAIDRYYNQEKRLLQLRYCGSIWAAVMGSRGWENLRQLWLFQCQVDDSNIDVLAEKTWQLLEQLCLYNNSITKHGMKTLIRNNSFDCLKYLNLNRNNIGSSGAKLVIKMHLPSLQKIGLWWCGIGDEGASHLSKNNWRNLKQFNIMNNNVKVSGFEAVAVNNHWKELKKLGAEGYDQCAYCIAYLSVVVMDSPNANIFLYDIQNQQMKSNIHTVLNNRFISQDPL